MKKKKQRIITFAARKGGVGKTTLTAALGFVLVRKGYTVALCDLDPQASLQLAVHEVEQEGLSIHTTLAAAQHSGADVVLVVTEPHAFALARTAVLLDEIKAKAGRVRALVVNCASEKRRRDQEIIEGLEETGWPVWAVRSDTALATAFSEGRKPSPRGRVSQDLGTIASHLKL